MEAARTTPTLMERRRQDAAEEIARAAIELFTRDGFEATTVDAIAAEAGCSRRTFYRYFGSKEDVLFQDLPTAFERLREVLEAHLEEGLDLWTAVAESVVDMIGRFEGDEKTAVMRMVVWQREPALHARYMLHVDSAEKTIAETLCRYRGTRPEEDDLAQAMAITAIGAYRATVATHSPEAGRGKLAKHLRDLLATLDGELSGHHHGAA
jgi:AcrR family transcriptional regulator